MNKGFSQLVSRATLVPVAGSIHQTRTIRSGISDFKNTMAGSDFDDASEHPAISKLMNMADRGERPNRRGRGGKAGGGGGQGREVQVSKALSKLLRHAAEEEGVQLDKEGFARLDQVMQWNRLKSIKVTFEDIQTAVTDNAKQRFSMKANPKLTTPPSPTSTDPSDWVIRANQGHSIAVDSASHLSPINIDAGNVPEVVIHGTYFAFWQSIIETGGLKKMTRNHMHFSTGLPEDKEGVISGMRKDAELLIYVDIKQSLEDGLLWWISENRVVLSEGTQDGVLPMKYFQKVVGRKENVGVLWEEGVQVADLPEAQRNRKPPRGKETNGRTTSSGRGRGRGNGRGKLRGSQGELTEQNEADL